MEYRGTKAVWRLCLLEAVIIITSSIGSVYLEPIIGIYPAMTISPVLILIPIMLGIAFLKRYHGYAKLSSVMGFNGFDYGIAFLSILLPFATNSFATYIYLPYTLPMTALFGAQSDLPAPETVSEMLWLFANMCILAPVLEEILFRGIIIRILEPYGTGIAITISALMFSLLHFSVSVFFIIFAASLVMGFLRIYSGSVYPSMIFHSLFNLISFLAIVFESEIELFAIPLFIGAVISFIMFPILFVILHKKYGKGKWFNGTVRNFKGGRISLGIFIALYIIMGIASFVLNAPKLAETIINNQAIEDFYGGF